MCGASVAVDVGELGSLAGSFLDLDRSRRFDIMQYPCKEMKSQHGYDRTVGAGVTGEQRA